MNQEFENSNAENNEAAENTEVSENTENSVTDSVDETEKENYEKSEDASCEKPKKGWKRELIEWIESLGIAVIAALIIVNFVFSMVRVEGQSMEPTLQNKNFLFVFRLGYTPDNGDIVVFKPVGDPKKYYIKRVIATEGQTVNIVNGDVYVDEKLIEEDYTQGETYNNYGAEFPQTVPEDCVFVLGDNREHSRDSRDSVGVGMVKNKSIIGKALFRLFPLNHFGSLYK